MSLFFFLLTVHVYSYIQQVCSLNSVSVSVSTFKCRKEFGNRFGGRCGRICFSSFRSLSAEATVVELLKSVHTDRVSYYKNKSWPFLWTTVKKQCPNGQSALLITSSPDALQHTTSLHATCNLLKEYWKVEHQSWQPYSELNFNIVLLFTILFSHPQSYSLVFILLSLFLEHY